MRKTNCCLKYEQDAYEEILSKGSRVGAIEVSRAVRNCNGYKSSKELSGKNWIKVMRPTWRFISR